MIMGYSMHRKQVMIVGYELRTMKTADQQISCIATRTFSEGYILDYNVSNSVLHRVE